MSLEQDGLRKMPATEMVATYTYQVNAEFVKQQLALKGVQATVFEQTEEPDIGFAVVVRFEHVSKARLLIKQMDIDDKDGDELDMNLLEKLSSRKNILGLFLFSAPIALLRYLSEHRQLEFETLFVLAITILLVYLLVIFLLRRYLW